MTQEERIADILSRHPKLDEDSRQDVILKAIVNIHQYDESRCALSTWLYEIAKNHLIDKSRRIVNKRSIPMSYYDFEYGDFTGNHILDNSFSNDLNPEDDYILNEELDNALELIKMLPDAMRDAMQKVMDGETNLSPTDRVNIHRARIALESKKIKKELKFNLRNIKTDEVYEINSFAEAADIIGCSTELARVSHRKNKIFANKMWKIETKS